VQTVSPCRDLNLCRLILLIVPNARLVTIRSSDFGLILPGVWTDVRYMTKSVTLHFAAFYCERAEKRHLGIRLIDLPGEEMCDYREDSAQ